MPLALLVSSLLAAAGGGSSGFGGGGGGGGFSGGGSYSGGGATTAGGPVSLVIILLVVVAVVIPIVVSFFKLRRMRARRAERDARVRLAAVEAAQDDAAFAAQEVERETIALFAAIQIAWDARDVGALERLVGADLMVEWRRRLADFARKGWHNRVRVLAGPEIRYVGLVNRERDEEDRVTVHVDARLEDYVEARGGRRIMRHGEEDTTTTLSEYWTLAKREGRWTLLSIEQDAEGAHHLDAPIVASPWDDQRLADEALVEGALADAAPPGARTAELVDVDLTADARAQALDLSLVDARFAPDVLAAAARSAAAAWAEAVDGPDAALERIAAPGAAAALLYGGDEARATRLVVRGPQIDAITIERLEAASEPPTMTLEVRVRGRRYVEDRDSAAVLSGAKDVERVFAERWTMALADAGETPWRLVGVAGARA